VALLRAAFSGARANLERTLTSLTDIPYTTSIVEEMALLSDQAAGAATAAETAV